MKKTLLSLFLMLAAMSYSQDKWQQMMFDKDANFYDIKADFERYYSNIVSNSRELPKGKGIKQFKRWEYYWESRVDENGNFPNNGYLLEEINRYRDYHSNNQRYTTGSGNWEIVGPVSLPNNGTGQLNGNGRINCIAFHPTDANTIYVGAPSGGFWKTTDGGNTWTDNLNGLVRLGISSIVINPSNPDIIYIGTGDRDGGDAPGYGVWRSTDGGVTWASRNSGMGNRTVYEIIMDPSDSNIMVASTSGNRIYKTTNGGASWSVTSIGQNAKDIAYHPTNSNIVYASGTLFHKSTDGGSSFTQITSGVPSSVQRIALAVSVDEPDWVYLLAGDGNGLVGVYRSTDSGTSFSTRSTTPNILGWNTDGSGTGSQAWYDLVIAADPTDANTIYTGGVNLWRSTDGGANMSCVSYWVGVSGSIDGVHADQHALEFSPHNNNLFNGNDGGVYYSANNGTNWTDISSGLAIAQIYKIGVSQTAAELVINGYQDNGTAISRSNTFITEIGGDGMECIIDPTDENYMYGALYYGDIRRSTNNGSSFSAITTGITETGGWVTPYKLDPNNANRMFAGYDNIWRNDAVKTGTTWTQISSFGGTSNIRDLAIAPSNSDVMYVSRYDNSFRRTNNATSGSPTWTNLTGNLPVANEPIDIEIDPNDPTHLFIALNNNIYESNDSGDSWSDISGTLPNISLNSIIIDETSPVDAMYIGMDVGIYYKDSSLSDWVSYSNGFPNLEVTELEIHYGTDCKGKIYAATYGQGLWISDLKDPGNVAPIACFEASTTDGCVGNEFTLTDNSDYSPTSWSWTITPNTFSYINSTSATSQNPEVTFNNAGAYTIALTVTNTYGSDTETKTAYITISNGTLASSFDEDFESESLCATTNNCGSTVCGLTGLWTNLANGSDDDIDWRIDEGGTPSADTGPSVDYNPGSSSGNYAYLEASGGCTNNTAILESDCIIIDQTYNFTVGYHMYGTDVGSLHIDLFNDGSWQEDIVTAISGNKGNSWSDLLVDLSAYVGKTIKIRVRGITGNGWSSDIAIDDIKFTALGCSVTVWDGSSWSNGAPSLSKSVTINGNYDTSMHGSFECCTLLVNAGREVIINDSDYISIDNNLTNNGTLTIENNGSLIQVDNNAVNVGTINFKRTASIRQLDYVYWSSPIQGFDVANISTNTPTGLIYKWDPIVANANGGQGNWINTPSELMVSGKGYIVRGPSNYNSTPQDFTAEFQNGKPNNGLITVPISRGSYTGTDYSGNNAVTITRFDDNWNLVGNPYPSAINTLDFLNLNSSIIEGAIRIWTHGTLPSSSNADSFYGNFATSYSPSDYIVHNGTGTVSGPNGFNGLIAGGQGFMVLMNDGSTLTDNLTFNNSLRDKSYANNEFYRSSQNEELDRLWLNLSNEEGVSERTLIAYLNEATDFKDRLYDAVTRVDDGSQKIYSFIEADKMAIQAFGLPFSVDDIIPIGINIPVNGNYYISIHDVEGLFTEHDVYLQDLLLNTFNNISEAPYIFYSESGEINNRFVLRFNDAALSTEDFEVFSNGITISGKDKIHIQSVKENLNQVVVYDVLGRQITDTNNINNQSFEIDSINKSNAILLLKITLSNEKTIYRKIIF
ncbi:VPS10 domain-containing protein [Hanstruepera ponticola]|uniref:VPS10 domain-containing protein n=1 Tax=Hanstruepera ponticola TaxID=2042995 RepID=UPI0013C3ED0A|nr:T9SS sorting signal type C domain-containing protein [Hanstruepera ponticola]